MLEAWSMRKERERNEAREARGEKIMLETTTMLTIQPYPEGNI